MENLGKKTFLIINIILGILIIYFAKGIISHSFFNQTMVVVPNVTNLNKDEAAKVLKSYHLEYNFISSRSSEVPYDIVYKQSPEANEKVKVKRAIKLYINNAEGEKIPDLKNLVVEDAINILKEKNIEIERVDYIQKNVEEDTVISTDPKAGDLVKYKEKISLLVATRKLKLENRVPNIIGMNILDGERALKKAGYEKVDIIGVQSSNFPVNSVVKVDPSPNTELDKNELIRVYISISDDSNKEVEERQDLEKKIEEIIKKSIDENEN